MLSNRFITLASSLLAATALASATPWVDVTAANGATHGTFEPNQPVEFRFSVAVHCSPGSTIQSLSVSISDTYATLDASGSTWRGEAALIVPAGQLRTPIRPAYCLGDTPASGVFRNAATALVTLTCATTSGSNRQTVATPLDLTVHCDTADQNPATEPAG